MLEFILYPPALNARFTINGPTGYLAVEGTESRVVHEKRVDSHLMEFTADDGKRVRAVW